MLQPVAHEPAPAPVTRQPVTRQPEGALTRDARVAAVTSALDASAAIIERLFSPRASGAEHLEAPGPALLVANHGGGVLAMLEPLVFAHAIRGALGHSEAMPRVLAHEALFRTPAAAWLESVGARRASPDNARALLAEGHKVLVYPGGDREAFRPFAQRHRVTLGDRRGYARTALEAGAPIVPVVTAGMHSGFVTLSDGSSIARSLPFARALRVGVVPITFSVPFGLSIGLPPPYLPVDARVRIRVLPPIHGRRAAAQGDLVEDVHALVLRRMQAAMDALAEERRAERREALRRGLDSISSRVERTLGGLSARPLLSALDPPAAA